jgi:hypothetical protein
VTAKRVANLVTQESGDADTDGHDPDAFFFWMRGRNQTGRENERVTGDERNESADKQTGSGEN